MARKAKKRRERGGSGLFWLALLGFIIFFLAMQVVRSVEPFGMDQGLFGCFGKWVPRGALPYRDIWDSKPPLILYTYPLAFVLTGGGVGGMWLFEGAWLALTAGSAFLLGRRLWGRAGGLAAAVFVFTGLWSAGLEGYTSRSQSEEFLALPLLGAAWFLLGGRERDRSAFLSGVLLGVAGLYKVPALIVAAAWPVALWPGLEWKVVLRRTGLAALGTLAPWLLAAGWFALHGAFGDFVDAVFIYNRHYAEMVGGGASLAGVGLDFIRRIGLSVPTAVLAAGIGAAFAFLRRERRIYWLVAWLLLAAFAVIAQKQIAGYHCLLVIPPLALLAARGVAALATAAAGGRRPLRVAAMLALAAAGLVEGNTWFRVYGRDLGRLSGRITQERYLASFQVGPFSPLVERQVAQYLRKNCPLGKRVLVWGLSPGIYVLADRRPATRFPFHHLLLTDSPLSQAWGSLATRRRQFIENLRRDPPAFVLVGTRDRNGFEPEDSRTQMVRFPEFRNFLGRHYEEQRRIANFIVYALR
ncbi:MAG: hypothetical protein Q9Q40_09095 [Acidobacteriota bacterium]|nr:hypothetical protein [Acidobacteriota bacterium]MDQ7086600.1 hypothetical protein [Acidobacteriota bacterium]